MSAIHRLETTMIPGTSTPQPTLDIRRVRKWGDPEMVKWGFDYDNIETSNFQAVKTWNDGNRTWGAVSNFLRIPNNEILKLRDMQFPQQVGDKFHDRDSKMEWLCGWRGNMYMYESEADRWQTAPAIRWGTVSLGGNLVQVERYEWIRLAIDNEPQQQYEMARLRGFRRADWSRPLDQLLTEGLVHRCYCVYKNNGFSDTPKGIIYSPFFQPSDEYDFAGTARPTALYLLASWLEN
jgi:hypothetical protein